MVLTGMCPREPQDCLERGRLLSFQLATFISKWCGDRLDGNAAVTIAQGRNISNTLRDLADAYEGMVEAMHYEHDWCMAEVRENAKLRDSVRLFMEDKLTKDQMEFVLTCPNPKQPEVDNG